MLHEGLGTDAQDEIANLKLGLAEQIVLGLADQESSQIA